MAFLYPNKPENEVSDIEIIQDVLLTQNKIEADLRDTMALVRETSYGKRVGHFYRVSLNGSQLTEALIKACMTVFLDRDKELLNLDSDLSLAWVKFEHFQFPPISDCIESGKLDDVSSRWMREKYRDYNKCVMPYYDFFMKLSDEERLEKLLGQKYDH